MAINPMDAQGGGITQAMPQAGGPDPRRPQGQIGGDLLKALAAQKLLRDKQMAERQLAMAQEADANTVVAKNEAELSQRSLGEVSKGVSDVLCNVWLKGLEVDRHRVQRCKLDHRKAQICKLQVSQITLDLTWQ